LQNKLSASKPATPAAQPAIAASPAKPEPPKHTKEEMEAMSKEVAHHLELYSAAHKLSKDHPCYNPLCKPNSGTPNCYSPMCIQRYRLRKELLMTLCKAKSMGIDINSKIGAQASIHQKAAAKKPEPEAKADEKPEEPKPVEEKVEVKQEVKQEVIQEETKSTELTLEKDENSVQVTTTTTTTTTTTVTESVTTKVSSSESGVLKAALSKSRQHVSRPQPEPVDKQRVYSADTPSGKLYLKKLVRATTTTTTTTTSALSTVLSGGAVAGRRKKLQVKYPLCSKFQSHSNKQNILILPQHELRKMARKGGYCYVQGFSHTAKANQTVWPYPCPRPLFKTCWMYRITLATTLSTVAMQLRILWHCLRWDDMQVIIRILLAYVILII
jgi:nucleosome-remodeling factor subunit BPTF